MELQVNVTLSFFVVFSFSFRYCRPAGLVGITSKPVEYQTTSDSFSPAQRSQQFPHGTTATSPPHDLTNSVSHPCSKTLFPFSPSPTPSPSSPGHPSSIQSTLSSPPLSFLLTLSTIQKRFLSHPLRIQCPFRIIRRCILKALAAIEI